MARISRRLVAPRQGGSVLLDAEGLSKAAARQGAVAAAVLGAHRRKVPVFVSALTLAEVLRGHHRDVAVYRLLKLCRVMPVNHDIGRSAGELLGRTGRKDTVDAVVVATASTLPMPVRLLTSDPSDLGALTADLADVRVEPV